MDEGAEFATVLAEAQAKGYAEADPTEDVAASTHRSKLAILMRLALRVIVDPDEIVPQPITRGLGCRFQLCPHPGLHHSPGGARSAGQGPCRPPRWGPCWSISVRPSPGPRGTENMVVLTGHYGGDVVFSGHGAGGHPTAVAVVSELLALAHDSRRVRRFPQCPRRLGAEFEVPHYIRLPSSIVPASVAEITGALAKERINIRAIVAKARLPPATLFLRRHCRALQVLGHCSVPVAAFRTMDCLIEEPLDLQMLE